MMTFDAQDRAEHASYCLDQRFLSMRYASWIWKRSQLSKQSQCLANVIKKGRFMRFFSVRQVVHTQMTVFVTMCIKSHGCDDTMSPVYPDLPCFDKDHGEL
jgi:hypothetical protein